MSGVTLIGDKELNKEIERIASLAPKAAERISADMAFDVTADSIRSIQKSPPSGRKYKRGSVAHVASSEGNPPRTDTGDLIRNITAKKELSGWTAGSRKGAPHGFWLEFGTRHIAKRPWLQPAYNKVVKNFEFYAKKHF